MAELAGCAACRIRRRNVRALLEQKEQKKVWGVKKVVVGGVKQRGVAVRGTGINIGPGSQKQGPTP